MEKVPHCKRTGNCCLTITISLSPKALRERYETYLAAKETNEFYEDDVSIIYPMLKDTCKGKVKGFYPADLQQFTYIYGPCKNLKYTIENNKLISSCGIQNNKPTMCSKYPWYEEKDQGKWNMATFKGCGFNKRKGKELTWPADKLLPLDPEEL